MSVKRLRSSAERLGSAQQRIEVDRSCAAADRSCAGAALEPFWNPSGAFPLRPTCIRQPLSPGRRDGGADFLCPAAPPPQLRSEALLSEQRGTPACGSDDLFHLLIYFLIYLFTYSFIDLFLFIFFYFFCLARVQHRAWAAQFARSSCACGRVLPRRRSQSRLVPVQVCVSFLPRTKCSRGGA